ncbi:MAG TPA: ATP-binding cassette domain-containing protein [Vicinamibacterales bacterium]|nr:ATP-binding cassette domain-containing protein [Vicinamibacterales bacterium]
MEPALVLRDVRKSFGSTKAVDGMNLTVPRGALYGVIGPNGAGKTTCIRMVMSILFPDSGELSVLGGRSALEAKDRIGYLPEERGVYRKMKVAAFLVYMAQLKGVRADEAASRVPRLLADMNLAGAEGKLCEDLSKGMLQRVQFVSAIIHQPELLILDEPFSGQDPVSVRLLRDHILREHRRGATVLLSTHVMANAEEMCQHVVMIHQGRKVLDEPMAGLRRQFDPRTIRFEPLHSGADTSPLRAVPGVERVEPTDEGGCTVVLTEGTDPATAIARLAAVVAPARIEIARLRLEDVFIRIVSAGAAGSDAARALRAGLQSSESEGALA